jgi:hypothetical protein
MKHLLLMREKSKGFDKSNWNLSGGGLHQTRLHQTGLTPNRANTKPG